MNNEQAFLKEYNQNQYDKPSITADVLTLAMDMNNEPYRLQVLLLQRDEHPYKGCWSLPGGFMQIDETLEETAYRVIHQKTGLETPYVEQLYTFSDLYRDPRMRILSTTYLNLIHKKGTMLHENCRWFDLTVRQVSGNEQEGLLYEIVAIHEETVLKASCNVKTIVQPNRLEKVRQEMDIVQSDFAFDHAKMICMGVLRIANKINYTNVAFHFMEQTFTIPALQKVYECILQKELYKTSFRNQIKHLIEETGEKVKADGFAKPSKLYRYMGGRK